MASDNPFQSVLDGLRQAQAALEDAAPAGFPADKRKLLDDTVSELERRIGSQPRPRPVSNPIKEAADRAERRAAEKRGK